MTHPVSVNLPMKRPMHRNSQITVPAGNIRDRVTGKSSCSHVTAGVSHSDGAYDSRGDNDECASGTWLEVGEVLSEKPVVGQPRGCHVDLARGDRDSRGTASVIDFVSAGRKSVRSGAAFHRRQSGLNFGGK